MFNVSVVIPLFNGSRFVASQLESLALEKNRPATPPFEVLVADNGSTDGSAEIAAGFTDRLQLRVIDAFNRPGQAHARNVASAAASAERLLFLDQDDTVAPGYIEAMCQALDTNAFVAARMDRSFLNPGWRQGIRDLAQETGLGLDGPRLVPWAYGCTLGIRRETFRSLKGFDESLPVRAGEDVEFCRRASHAGISLVFVPDAVVRYRFPVSLGAILRQGVTYGHAGAYVDWSHGSFASATLMAGICTLLGPAKLMTVGPSAGERAHGLFLLGRRIGHLRACRDVRLGRWGQAPDAQVDTVENAQR